MPCHAMPRRTSPLACIRCQHGLQARLQVPIATATNCFGILIIALVEMINILLGAQGPRPGVAILTPGRGPSHRGGDAQELFAIILGCIEVFKRVRPADIKWKGKGYETLCKSATFSQSEMISY